MLEAYFGIIFILWEVTVIALIIVLSLFYCKLYDIEKIKKDIKKTSDEKDTINHIIANTEKTAEKILQKIDDLNCDMHNHR